MSDPLASLRASLKAGKPTAKTDPVFRSTGTVVPTSSKADPLAALRASLKSGKPAKAAKVAPLKAPSQKVADITDAALQSFHDRGGLRSVYIAGALGLDQ